VRSCTLSGPSLDLIAPIRPLQLCADGGYQLRLGVLGVPLIMVPDKCLFTEKEVVVSKVYCHQVIFKVFIYNNLYLVDFTLEGDNLRTCLFTKTSLGWLWHRSLAHVGTRTPNKLLKKEIVRGLKDVMFEKTSCVVHV
jgi:hypothetical protein